MTREKMHKAQSYWKDEKILDVAHKVWQLSRKKLFKT